MEQSERITAVAWDNTILKKVLKVLSDSVEKCRELAINLINGVVNKIPKVRVATLQAINSVVLCGLPAGMVADVLAPAIKVLALDRTIGVREEHLAILLRSQQVLPIVTSCLEEDYYTDTRRVSCHVIEHILRIVGSELDDEQTTAVSKSLQKRLDDSNDSVRLGILPAISKLLTTVSLASRKIDMRGFLSDLILHMDDPNEQIQV